MTNTGTAGLLRNPDAPERATLLELLLDVVYVAALALISMRLSRDFTWAGRVQLLLLLMAIWWIWSITALLTDFYNPQRKPIQAMIAAVMLGSVLMTATLPRAFAGLGWAFAGTYVSIHILRGIVLVIALRGHNAQARAARFLFWFGVSAVPWVVGAFTSSPVRTVLWGVALAIHYISAAARYPTPRLGRVPLNQYAKTSEHFGERYQQFIILALGDLILVPTLKIGAVGLAGERVAPLLLAFVTMLLLWQIYVYRAGALLQGAIHEKPGRGARLAPYTHFLMVVGVVLTAAGSELVIDRPNEVPPVQGIWIIVGGPTLFLIGRTIFEYEVFESFSGSRLAWLVLLVATAPLTLTLTPLFVTIVTGAILFGVAVTDAVRGRRTAPPQTTDGRTRK